MKVLYLSQTENLQVTEIDTILDCFLKNEASSALLKTMAIELDTQGFSIGHQAVFGHFVVINLNLPNNNLLILSNEELKALYSYAVLGHEGTPEDLLTDAAKIAWVKIGELVAQINKEKRDAK